MWHDVSAVGANAIAEWAWSRHRLKLFIIVVPHTFGGALVFKPHLHLMVSAGGLNLSTDRWHDSIEFFEDEIMQAWRFALTDYLRASIRKRLYVPDLPLSSEQTVAAQARRPWNVKITKAMSKWRFVNYAGRYIRRLPISQQRILSASDTEIAFQSKDTRASKSAGYTVWIEQRCTPAKFIDLLSQHLPDRYRHSMRYFGLLAPPMRGCSSKVLRLALNQPERKAPRRRPLATLIRQQFGYDPLLDSQGNRMRWMKSIPPQLRAV